MSRRPVLRRVLRRDRRRVRRRRVLVSLLLLGAGPALGGSASGCETDPDPAGEADPQEERAPAFGERTGGQVRIVDDADRTVTLAEPPERIVSLVPSATEILLALGAGDRLVGRTDFDTIPPLAGLPSVGGGLHPSIERLVALEPDLVIRFAGPSDRNTPDRLTRLDVAHIAVRPDGIDDVRRIVTLLGRAVGEIDRAAALVARTDSSLAAVAERVASRPPRTVAFVLGGSPPWVAGPGTFVDELLRVAGGRNAFSDLGELYGPVSREAFVSRSIELVLTTNPAPLGFLPPGMPVERVPATVETPGLALGASARILASRIHPDAFR